MVYGFLMKLHVIGFGSLNLDEFWEVPAGFLEAYELMPGKEYARDLDWFREVCPRLAEQGVLKAADPGGSSANMIAALHRMGFETGFYGATGGADTPSLRLNELGPSHHLSILYSELPAGRCLSLINREDLSRDRALVILPNANDLAGSRGIDLSYFGSSYWVHMSSFVSKDPLRAQIELARTLPDTTRLSFDPGPIYCSLGIGHLRQILLRTEILFTTEEELIMLTGNDDQESAVNHLLGVGITTVVVKRGSRGITGIVAGRVVHQEALPPSRIVDRTGAGDVAAAGFLAGTIMNLGIEACLELAASAASKSIAGYGRTAYPDKAFLEEFVQRCAKSARQI
jgi:ribokinase